MTLIVSLITPDGIVLAGDSLASMMSQMNYQTEINTKCPQCGHDHTFPLNVPLPPVPATTLSYAQKIFPLFKKYGVGTFGMGMLLGKSIYYVIREFEQNMPPDIRGTISGATDLANILSQHIHEILKKQFAAEGIDIATFPNQVMLGFQIVGYDNGESKLIEVFIGKDIKMTTNAQAGCMISGQGYVAESIWALYKDPNQAPAFEVFSLQDAISYAEFLIRTTTLHQQFSRTMPNVGGDIDIALVTPYNDFRWIRQKPLAKLLEESK